VSIGAAALWGTVLTATASSPAPGPAAVIAVVAPPASDPAVTEALNRFRGEAASVGFEVTVVPGSAASPPRDQMELAAHATSAVATVAFVNGVDPHALDVWFTDRSTGQTLVGHVSVENETGDRASLVLAVKAVDFLRARMFDFLVGRPRVAADLTGEVESSPGSSAGAGSPPPSRGNPRFGLSLGVAALRSLHGLGTTALPVLRGAYDVTAWSSLRITLGGLGSRSRVEVMGGSGSVGEELAMAEWTVMPVRARVRPLLTVGAGVHDVRAQGAAVAPYTARAAGQLSFAAALSVGLRVTLGRHLALGAEAGSFLLFPEPSVLVAGLDGGRTGRPGLSATVTAEARF
jgi:hypothetical protein